ncbi:MAG: lytic transglycosylase [Spirochaetaceae bacterium]|nr:lytic transglycosylase [Spirochaetaceae bacterium]
MSQKDTFYSNNALKFWGIFAFCLLFICASFACLVFFPSQSENNNVISDVTSLESQELPVITESEKLGETLLTNNSIYGIDIAFGKKSSEIFLDSNVEDFSNSVDIGLELYRSVHSRAAVEWFYTNITGSRDVACAVLEAADKNDIPVSLAFALAHTESRYKITAVNKNTNSSIDRGIFQLNNKSFPALTEEDFFNPYISAKYGMSHLRHCLNTAGNEVSALAMYNAGTNRVRNNETPQVTLNYVSKIFNYRQNLEDLFNTEVVLFYQNSSNQHLASAKTYR